MRSLLPLILDAAGLGPGVACCRLVDTRGSTPQKPGATMLVRADGRQSGTIGGGCVEAEVKRQALRAIPTAQAAIHSFQLDDDYGWDDGLICGGRMRILLEPIGPESVDYYQKFNEAVRDGSGATEAIVVDAEQAGLPETAAYLFSADGRFLAHARGPLSGGGAPETIRAGLARLGSASYPSGTIRRPAYRQGVAYLPMPPRLRLLIVGGGHVGQAVAELASKLDFDVWVVDDRQEYVSPERFPGARRRIFGPMREVLQDVEVTPNTYCLIVTRGHNHDEEALYCLAERGAAYIGMIGSRRKIRLIFDDLLAEGIAPAALERVHAPVGLNIGSQTVAEIAVSIAAEMVAFRNLGTTALAPLDRQRHAPADRRRNVAASPSSAHSDAARPTTPRSD